MLSVETWILALKSIRNSKHIDKYQRLVFPLHFFNIITQSKNYNTVMGFIIYIYIYIDTVYMAVITKDGGGLTV